MRVSDAFVWIRCTEGIVEKSLEGCSAVLNTGGEPRAAMANR